MLGVSSTITTICGRCPASLTFEVERQAGGNSRQAFERRLKIKISDALGECFDFRRSQHASKARPGIDDEVGGFAVVAFQQLLEASEGFLNRSGIIQSPPKPLPPVSSGSAVRMPPTSWSRASESFLSAGPSGCPVLINVSTVAATSAKATWRHRPRQGPPATPRPH
jgi:hypothetical protein